MMRERKRIIVIGAAILLMAISIAGVTYSFLIDKVEKDNEFIVGKTSVQVEETSFVPPDALVPGVKIPKDPIIYNNGTGTCFVRMRVEYSNPQAAQFSSWENAHPDLWEYDSDDGYYYYKEALNPETSTKPLFEKVEVDEENDMEDLVEFEILVYAESVEHPEHDGSCPADEYKTVWSKY